MGSLRILMGIDSNRPLATRKVEDGKRVLPLPLMLPVLIMSSMTRSHVLPVYINCLMLADIF